MIALIGMGRVKGQGLNNFWGVPVYENNKVFTCSYTCNLHVIIDSVGLRTQLPKFKIETPESCNSVATRLPCANIASGSFSLSHFLLSPLKTKRGKRAMFSSSSLFEDVPLLKLS